VLGYAPATTGVNYGVYGRSDSPNGFGVQARNAGAAGLGAAIQAIGVNNHGLVASTDIATRYAVHGTNNAPTLNGGTAILGQGGANGGVSGTSSNSYGVHGSSTGGPGVDGFSWTNDGVYGKSNAFRGVEGRSEGGVAGVYGSSSGPGVEGAGSPGVYGVSASGTGVEGFSQSAHGVIGSVGTDEGTAAGVYGESAGSNSYAGYFVGRVSVTGTLSKGGGSFRIDHPLDPANRILQHSFVESPDMLNIYNGVVTADANGQATVQLPDWFMALNRDFRYGLTPLGEFAPVYVKAKVAKGRFTIAGARPGQEISWQLTGVRRDAWAEAHRVAVELDKAADQRGRYLHPAEHGQPLSKGVDYPMQQRLAAAREQAKKTVAELPAPR
jgi:hypothetical protein